MNDGILGIHGRLSGHDQDALVALTRYLQQTDAFTAISAMAQTLMIVEVCGILECRDRMCSESTAESEPSYLTVGQLAHRLQVSVSTIYGWVDQDYIPFLKAGDLARFDPGAIHSWMMAEADRKREKKRGLREVRGKVTPAPGGCNRKGAIG